MRKPERFLVLEADKLRGGRLDWVYAYMVQGRREAKAVLRNSAGLARVFVIDAEGNPSDAEL